MTEGVTRLPGRATSTVPMVTVRGEAQLEGPPDLADFSLTVHVSADSPEHARAGLAHGSVTVARLVKTFEEALERSSTSGVHVTPVFNRRTPTKITGYTGHLSTTLSVADFEALPALLIALTEMPDVSLDGPWWSLRRDNAMYRDVRLAAIGDARRRATDYAAAFGARIAELVEVSDLESGFSGGAREMRSFAMAKGAGDEPAFQLEPATQTVSATVTVRFTVTGVSL